MRNDNNNRSSVFAAAARWAFCGVLAALPLGGLILFFEVTRPAVFPADTAVPTKLSTAFARNVSASDGGVPVYNVVHFKGVSAELSPARLPLEGSHVLSASDAVRAFAASSVALKAGFQSEFVTKEGRRVAIRIVGREPILDQALPDEERVIAITPASTAKVVNFVWGAWLYRAELEDKGAEPEIVVQKVL